MDHPVGVGLQRADRVDFDPRVRLEFRGAQISSDGGLLVMREMDDALGLSDLASAALCDTRRGKNTVHRLDGLFRQSVFGRLAEVAVTGAMVCAILAAIRRLRAPRHAPDKGPPQTGRKRQGGFVSIAENVATRPGRGGFAV